MSADRDIDIFIRNGLIDGPSLRAGALDRVFAVLPATPQQRRGWLALPPGGGVRTVLSATRFVVAGVIVSLFAGYLLLAGLSPQPSEVAPPAAAAASTSPEPDQTPTATPSEKASASPVSGRVIVVSEFGGDATTISAAVEMAQDGDTILVRPPLDASDELYVEAGLTIAKDITIRGDGERERVRMRLLPSTSEQHLDNVLVGGAEVVIENITLLADDGGNLHVGGGALTLTDVTVDHLRVESEDSHLVIAEEPCEGGGFESEGGTVSVEANTFSGVGIRFGDSDGSSVRDNRISGADVAIAVGSPVSIEGNTVSLEGNTVTGSATGISILNADAFISDNAITGNAVGVAIGGSAATAPTCGCSAARRSHSRATRSARTSRPWRPSARAQAPPWSGRRWSPTSP